MSNNKNITSDEEFLNMGGVVDQGDSEASSLDSLLGGAQQGLTLGFADELSGGIQSGMDATQALLNKLGLMSESPTQVSERLADEGFTGDIGAQNTLEAYRIARDEERAMQNQLQQANPGMYMAGELGGALLTTPFIPGIGQSGQIAKSALTGAGIGAATGLGTSTADLTEGQVAPLLEDVAKSTALGGAIGAAIPAAIPAATSLLSKASDKVGKGVSKIEYLQDLIDTFKLGTKGESVVGKKASEQAAKELREGAKTTFSMLEKERDAAKQIVDESLMSGDKQGIRINAQPQLREMASKVKQKLQTAIPNTEIEQDYLTNLLKEFNNPNNQSLAPTEYNELIKRLREFSSQPVRPKDAIDNVKMLSSKLDEVIPGFKDANAKFSEKMTNIESLTKAGAYEDVIGQTTKMTDDVTKLENIAKVAEDKPEAATRLQELLDKGVERRSGQERVPALKESSPEIASFVENNLLQSAKKLNLSKRASGAEGAALGKGVVSTVLKSPYLASETAGRVTKGVSDIGKNLSKKSNQTVQEMGRIMMDMSKKVGGSKGEAMMRYGKQLAETKPGFAQKALISDLTQRPEFREVYRDVAGEEESSNEQQ